MTKLDQRKKNLSILIFIKSYNYYIEFASKNLLTKETLDRGGLGEGFSEVPKEYNSYTNSFQKSKGREDLCTLHN